MIKIIKRLLQLPQSPILKGLLTFTLILDKSDIFLGLSLSNLLLLSFLCLGDHIFQCFELTSDLIYFLDEFGLRLNSVLVASTFQDRIFFLIL